MNQGQQIENIKIFNESKNSKNLKLILDANIKLLNKIVNSFLRKNRNLQKEDLLSAGKEGLIMAIKKFNPSLGKDFTPYAQIWIKSVIRKYIFENSSNLTIKGKKAKKYFSNYHKIFGNQYDNFDYNQSAFFNAISSTHFSENEEAFSIQSQDKELENKELKFILNKEIEDFSKSLSNRDKSILFDRILDESPKTLQDLATKFDCTNQTISYRERKIFQKLRSAILNSKYKNLYKSFISDE